MELFWQNCLIAARQVVILYIIVAAGYVCDKTGVFTEKTARASNNLLFYLITPCVIINAFLTTEFTAETAKGLAMAGGGAALTHLAGIALSVPFFRDVKSFYPVTGGIFKRRGSWFGISVTANGYGMSALHLATLHGGSARARDGSKLIDIFPTFEGRKVPFVVQRMAEELTLLTRYGSVRFTFGSPTLLMAQGDKGMGLCFEKSMEQHETVKPRKGGAWESCPSKGTPLLFKGLEGSTFAFNDTWNWQTINYEAIKGLTYPGPDGRFTLAVDEFPYMAKVHDNYCTYAEGKADMQKSWEDFLAKYPKLIAPYDKKRENTAYALWSMLVEPTQTTPRWMMLMFPGIVASQWQQVQNGVALQDIPDLSRNLIMAPLERQGETGQLADSYDEGELATGGIKPGIYGWALKNIMSHHDLSKEWPREDLEKLYERAGKWAMWFMECRDDDGDGLPYHDSPHTAFQGHKPFQLVPWPLSSAAFFLQSLELP